MPGTYQAQVKLAADSSVPADLAINTFHFRIGDNPLLTDTDIITGQRDGQPDENGIHGDLSDLYVTIVDIFSQQINWAGSSIKWTNLSDPQPRVPLLDIPLDPVPVSTVTGAMPAEVAICSSFQADRVAGLPQARRRNRVYLGPLQPGVVNSTVGVEGRLTQVNMDLITGAFQNLAQNSNDQNNWQWVVYSPTDNADHVVKNGWVDNAFDTQRRRGVKPTVRTEWVESA